MFNLGIFLFSAIKVQIVSRFIIILPLVLIALSLIHVFNKKLWSSS